MLFGFSQFFLGEERVTTELLPFAHRRAVARGARVPGHADLRRGQAHGLLRPLLPRGVRRRAPTTLGEMLDQQRPNMNEDWEQLFDGILHDCAERLRKDPTDFEALVRGITVYMVVIEGTLALTGARFIIRTLKERELVPRLPAGLHRGQPRRVAPRRLRREVPGRRDQGRPGERQVIEDTLQETLPVAPLVFAPPWVDDPYDFETPFYHSSEIFEYAMKALSKKLAAMGLDPAMLAACAA